MTAYNNIDPKIAGLKQGHDSTVESKRVAVEAGIDNGYPLFTYEGNDKDVFLFRKNQGVILWDADFVASNSILVTIDGVAGTPVVFSGTHAATLELVRAGIEADFAGAVAVSTGAREITVTIEDDANRVVLAVVTLGASQAGSTYTYASTMIFKGFSLRTAGTPAPKKKLDGTVIESGAPDWVYKEAINSLIEGWITVETADTVVSQKPAYVVAAAGATQGKVTDETSGNTALAGVTIDESVTGAGLARVRVNK